MTGNVVGAVDFDPGPGTTTLTSAGSEDFFVAKYSSLGALVWAHRIGGPNADKAPALAIDAAGNVFVSGFFYNAAVDFDPGPGTFNLSTSGSGDVF